MLPALTGARPDQVAFELRQPSTGVKNQSKTRLPPAATA